MIVKSLFSNTEEKSDAMLPRCFHLQDEVGDSTVLLCTEGKV